MNVNLKSRAQELPYATKKEIIQSYIGKETLFQKELKKLQKQVKKNKKKIGKVNKKATEAEDKFLRTHADFENIKKRLEREGIL